MSLVSPTRHIENVVTSAARKGATGVLTVRGARFRTEIQ